MAQQTVQTTDNLNAGRTKINANFDEIYEESTWTPVLKGSTTPGTHTYSNQVGYYRRIGSLVVAFFRIDLSSKDAAMAGDVLIGGLPYTNLSNNYASISWGEISAIDFPTNYTNLGAAFAANTLDQITIRVIGDNQTVATLTASAISSSSRLRGAITYIKT